jgi:hypothetical protein
VGGHRSSLLNPKIFSSFSLLLAPSPFTQSTSREDDDKPETSRLEKQKKRGKILKKRMRRTMTMYNSVGRGFSSYVIKKSKIRRGHPFTHEKQSQSKLEKNINN